MIVGLANFRSLPEVTWRVEKLDLVLAESKVAKREKHNALRAAA